MTIRRHPRRWLLLAIALLLPLLLHAADAVPKLARHVTDLTGTLTAAQVDQLDAQLTSLEKSKGAQLVVLMVGSTGGQDIAEYSLAVAEANKIGRKGSDDGVLLTVAKDDHRVRIEVGYGLEGAIPDAATARITREYIAPKFRSNDYFGGISDAVGALTQLINGEALPPPVQGNAEHERSRGPGLQGGLMIGLFAALFLRGILGRLSAWVRVPLGAIVVGALLWLLISAGAGILGALAGGVVMLMSGGAGRSIGGGGWGGGFGGGGFGGGGGGGFGGGGFSGGGGSFGGGGSSGSW
ncbi:MAG: TPM domain-containing protein [Rhodanobacter sp.]